MATVAIVGAGPGGTSFLERLLASVPELLGDQPLDIHLVDPFPPGPGRIWRYEQSALLRMNSMAEDVTMFTDDSVRCEGPIRPGPSLSEWAERGAGPAAGHARADGRGGRPHRHHVPDPPAAERLPGVGLRSRRRRPAGRRHASTSTGPGRRPSTTGPTAARSLTLDGEPALDADVVVMALGHLDVDPTGPEADLAAFAADHGLFYLPPEYSADVDLSDVPAGADIVVRGMGLAFIDLMILLTEGRGGRFVTDADGRLALPARRARSRASTSAPAGACRTTPRRRTGSRAPRWSCPSS